MIVTENGTATDIDPERIEYMEGALQAVGSAVSDGLDVRGYFHWTFIDNFEWTQGYAITFGLVAVDRATFARAPKPSGWWLGEFARAARTHLPN
jgi:beta-glucosidase